MNQLPFELGNASDDRRHHTAVRRRQIEGQAVHRDNRHEPRLELPERVQEIKGAASPAGKLGHQYRIDLSPLSQCHHLLSLGPIELGARAGFFKDAAYLIAGTGGEGAQIAFLPGARLIGGRDPAIEGGALSQLKSLRLPGGNPLSLFGLIMGRSAMPRRRAVTRRQIEKLLVLPVAEPELIRHWTLDAGDLAAIERRRGDPNQLGFALQLCVFRYPGRLLLPREAIPESVLAFVACQLRVAPDALADYAERRQTRREQLRALRGAFGFRMFTAEHRRELLAWLAPVALGNTDAAAIAATLMGELRRQKIIAPGASVIERLVAAAAMLAERQVANQLTRSLLPAQTKALDALLTGKEGTSLSGLAWARQPPGAPGHRALARLVNQRGLLSAVGIDPGCAEGVHPERRRKLAREGARFTAQHLRALSPLRRRATLVATVLDTITRLTDDTVALFDRAVGRMFRRAEIREKDAFIRDARAINDKVRLLARLGAALLGAKESGADMQEAVASAIGWDKLACSVEEAKRLARPDKADLPALVARAWPILHRLGPLFLGSLYFRSVPAAAATLRSIELLRSIYQSGARKWPRSLPISFLRPVWREAVLNADGAERRIREAATLLALRDRLRAGDIWVEGSRQWRAVEDQLIAPALFAAMREARPLPIAAPATAEGYLAERRALLEQRLSEVAAKAVADKLEDVRIKGDELKITPLKAATPEAAEILADRLYAMMPNLRITSLLAEVDRWTGFSGAFTHLHSGAPADDRRIVLTAALADATNLGLTRMADSCARLDGSGTYVRKPTAVPLPSSSTPSNASRSPRYSAPPMCRVRTGSTFRPPARGKLLELSTRITSGPLPHFFTRTSRHARRHTTRS